MVNCQGGWHGDGSVGGGVQGRTGEVACPMPIRSIAALSEYVERYHPDSVNSTCGTHFHVSVKNHARDYELLAEPAFYQHFMTRLLAWRDINVTTNPSRRNLDNRIAGLPRNAETRNCYCCPLESAEPCRWHNSRHTVAEQRRQTGKSSVRYAHLNYCENTGKRTLEFRVLHGMKTPTLIMSAAELVFRAVEDYLTYRHTQIAALEADRQLASII